MARWSIRNYNAFVRDAKSDLGVSHSEAQQLYRNMRERLDRQVFAVDLERHPRMIKQELRKAEETVSKAQRIETREHAQEIASGIRGVPRMTDVDMWEDLYDGADDYDEVEYASSADYKRRS